MRIVKFLFYVGYVLAVVLVYKRIAPPGHSFFLVRIAYGYGALCLCNVTYGYLFLRFFDPDSVAWNSLFKAEREKGWLETVKFFPLQLIAYGFVSLFAPVYLLVQVFSRQMVLTSEATRLSWAAGNDEAMLYRLATDNSSKVKSAVASHRLISARIIASLLKDDDIAVLRVLAGNPYLTSEDQQELLRYPKIDQIAAQLIGNPCVQAEIVSEIVLDHKSAHAALAACQTLSLELLDLLARISTDEAVIDQLLSGGKLPTFSDQYRRSADSDTPREELAAMTTSIYKSVKLNLIKNPHTPCKALVLLARDTTEEYLAAILEQNSEVPGYFLVRILKTRNNEDLLERLLRQHHDYLNETILQYLVDSGPETISKLAEELSKSRDLGNYYAYNDFENEYYDEYFDCYDDGEGDDDDSASDDDYDDDDYTEEQDSVDLDENEEYADDGEDDDVEEEEIEEEIVVAPPPIDLSAELAKTSAVFLADFRGMDVAQATAVRDVVRNVNGRYLVLRRSIMTAAFTGTAFEPLLPLIDGRPIALVLCNGDEIEMTRACLMFHNDPGNCFKLIAGMVFDSILTPLQLHTISLLPPRKLLQANLLYALEIRREAIAEGTARNNSSQTSL